MKKYLGFYLYGPLASWGEVLAGEHRPTSDHPTKSALLGLMAAALGISRTEEEAQLELARSYRFGIRVDSEGEIIRDFQTYQVPTKEHNVDMATRKEQLVNRVVLDTGLSMRNYLCDSACTITVWSHLDNPPFSLEEIAQALREPKYTLFLGRKACLPALPLAPRTVEAETLAQAFEKLPFDEHGFLGGLPLDESPRYFWEGEEDEGLDVTFTLTRRDMPVSRQRRQFVPRTEHFSAGM